MNLSKYLPDSGLARQASLLFISLFLAIVFMGGVSTPTTGLDPSWQIGISKAHAEGLQWGEDIIFTFGSFGYLFFGSLVEKNFLEMQGFRYVLSFAWIFFSLRFALSFNHLLLKIVGILCLILIPSFINNIETQFILLIQLIILDIFSLNLKTTTKESKFDFRYYFYGIISIFFLLVKLSFGILSVVSFLAVVSLNSVFSFKSDRSLVKTIRPTSWLLFGYLTGLAVFFSPLANSPAFAVFIASLPGLAVAIVLSQARVQYFLDRNIIQKFSILLPILLLALIGFLGFSNSNLREFIIGSLSISSGYSQSMSLIGPQQELFIGFVLLFSFSLLAVVAIIYDPARNTGAALALFLLALVSFKHGFIRHDGHVLGFALVAPAYAFNFGSLFIPRVQKLSRVLKITWLAFISFCATLIIGFGTANSSLTQYYNFDLKAYASNVFNPKVISEKLFWLIQPRVTEQNIFTWAQSTLEPSVITSKAVLSKIEDKTVDVLPTEVAIAEANSIKWHPSPTLQSYAAYTRWLDNKNLAAYEDNSPERIIYTFFGIDGRHPYFDHPRTTLYQICNYSPFRFKKQPILASIGQYTVLKKRSTPLCSLNEITSVGQPVLVNWDERIDLNGIRDLYNQAPGNILLVSIDLQYSLLGKLYNFLLRTPPVYLKTIYENGAQSDFRLVIDNAKSTNIIGSLPLNLQESLRDFYGYDNLNKVRSISLSSPNTSVFFNAIKLEFSTLKKHVELPKDFNPDRYLKLNPDVKAAGSNSKEHFLTYGFFEGRPYK